MLSFGTGWISTSLAPSWCYASFCLTFCVCMFCGSCTGGMCHSSCSVNVECCCDCYRICRKKIMACCIMKYVGLTSDHVLPTSIQVMIALRYFAVRGFQTIIDDLHGVHRTSVSRAIHTVSAAMSKRIGHYVKFPSTKEEIRRTIRLFFYYLWRSQGIGCSGRHSSQSGTQPRTNNFMSVKKLTSIMP